MTRTRWDAGRTGRRADGHLIGTQGRPAERANAPTRPAIWVWAERVYGRLCPHGDGALRRRGYNRRPLVRHAAGWLNAVVTDTHANQRPGPKFAHQGEFAHPASTLEAPQQSAADSEAVERHPPRPNVGTNDRHRHARGRGGRRAGRTLSLGLGGCCLIAVGVYASHRLTRGEVGDAADLESQASDDPGTFSEDPEPAGALVGGTGEGTIGPGSVGLRGNSGESGTGSGSGLARGSGAGFGGRGTRVPRVRQAAATVKGAIDKDTIRRIVRSHINEVSHCYNKGLVKDPELKGRVSIQFTIGPTGNVPVAVVQQSSVKDASVGQCIAAAVKRWKFPKPDGGGNVVVTYPFMLESDGG